MGKKWDRIGDVGKATGGFSKGAKAEKGVRGEIRSLPTYKPSGNVKCRNCGRWKIGHVPGDGGGGGLKCLCEKPDFPNVSLEYSVKMQEWHHGWVEEVYRVLKPNGIIKAFSGTRTFHRLAAAMEDAGFTDIRVEAWCYGSGFPKSRSISKDIDKTLGLSEKLWATEKGLVLKAAKAKGSLIHESISLVFVWEAGKFRSICRLQPPLLKKPINGMVGEQPSNLLGNPSL